MVTSAAQAETMGTEWNRFVIMFNVLGPTDRLLQIQLVKILLEQTDWQTDNLKPSSSFCLFCVYCPGNQLGANRQSSVHANSFNKNAAPMGKTAHAFGSHLAKSLTQKNFAAKELHGSRAIQNELMFILDIL